MFGLPTDWLFVSEHTPARLLSSARTFTLAGTKD